MIRRISDFGGWRRSTAGFSVGIAFDAARRPRRRIDVVELFTPPRGPSADDIRSRTTVHFTPYGPDELFVGGRAARGEDPDVTVALSDWSMSTRQQSRAAAALSPLVGELYGANRDSVNLRFHSYPPSDFAVGGVLLSRRLPLAARVAKRLLG